LPRSRHTRSVWLGSVLCSVITLSHVRWTRCVTDFVGVDTQVCGPSYTAGEHAPFGDVSRTTAVMSWLFKKKKVRTQTLFACSLGCERARMCVQGAGARSIARGVCWSKWPECGHAEMCERWPHIIVCGRGHGPPARDARMALRVRLGGCAALAWGLCAESSDVLLIVLLFPMMHTRSWQFMTCV
jgi:hypothetical protein